MSTMDFQDSNPSNVSSPSRKKRISLTISKTINESIHTVEETAKNIRKRISNVHAFSTHKYWFVPSEYVVFVTGTETRSYKLNWYQRVFLLMDRRSSW